MERSAPDLLDVLAFIRVVDTGSFAAAAERMGLSKPAISRRVARLEERLGAQLLTRTARGAQPTAVGKTYYASTAAILANLETAQEQVADEVTRVAGPIRLSAPMSFGIGYLAPALAEFATLHPDVELDLEFGDRKVDLVGGGYDLAVRIGTLADSALVARRIAPVRKVLVAGPAYLLEKGRPAQPAELANHDALFYGDEQWRFLVRGRWEAVRGRARMRANNGEMLLAAARAGLGVALLPSFIAAPAIADGGVEMLLRDYALDEGGLYAIMPPGRAATARVRALVEFLVDRFGPEPAWDPCWLAQEREQAAGTAGASASPLRRR